MKTYETPGDSYFFIETIFAVVHAVVHPMVGNTPRCFCSSLTLEGSIWVWALHLRTHFGILVWSIQAVDAMISLVVGITRSVFSNTDFVRQTLKLILATSSVSGRTSLNRFIWGISTIVVVIANVLIQNASTVVALKTRTRNWLTTRNLLVLAACNWFW